MKKINNLIKIFLCALLILPAKVGYADVRKVKDNPVMIESSSKSGQNNGQGLRVEYSGFGQLDKNKYKVVVGVRKEKIGDILRIDEGKVSLILSQEGEEHTTETKVIEKSYSKGCKDGVLAAGDGICRVSMVVIAQPMDNVFADRHKKDGDFKDKSNNQEDGDKEKKYDNEGDDLNNGEKFYSIDLEYTLLSGERSTNKGYLDINESISDILVDSDPDGKEGMFFIKNISPSKKDVLISKISRLSQDSYIDYAGTIDGKGVVQDFSTRRADKDEKNIIKSGYNSRFILKQSDTCCNNVDGGECTDSMIIEFEIGGKRKTAIVDFVVDYSGGAFYLIFSRHKDKIIWGVVGVVTTAVMFKYFMDNDNSNDKNKGENSYGSQSGRGDKPDDDDKKGSHRPIYVDNRHFNDNRQLTVIHNHNSPSRVTTHEVGVGTEDLPMPTTNTNQPQQQQNNTSQVVPQVVTTSEGTLNIDQQNPEVANTNPQPQQIPLQTTSVVNSSSTQNEDLINREWQQMFDSIHGGGGLERVVDENDWFVNIMNSPHNNSRQVINVDNSANLGLSGDARAMMVRDLRLQTIPDNQLQVALYHSPFSPSLQLQPEQRRSEGQNSQWLQPIMQQIALLQIQQQLRNSQNNDDRLQREYSELLRRQIDGELVVRDQQLLQQLPRVVDNGQTENRDLGLSLDARAMIAIAPFNGHRPEVNNNEFLVGNVDQLLNRPIFVIGDHPIMDEEQILPQQQQLVDRNQQLLQQGNVQRPFVPPIHRVNFYYQNQQPLNSNGNRDGDINFNSRGIVNSLMARIRNIMDNIAHHNGGVIRTENFWTDGYFTHHLDDRRDSSNSERIRSGSTIGSLMRSIAAMFGNVGGGGIGIGDVPYDGSY